MPRGRRRLANSPDFVSVAKVRLAQLERERAALHQFLAAVGETPVAFAARQRAARQPSSRGGRRKGFKMSAAAKAKISAAAKKRWAARRAAERK